jgi:hypothetical protein
MVRPESVDAILDRCGQARNSGEPQERHEGLMAFSDWMQSRPGKEEDRRLGMQISNIILDAANSYNEATTNDPQSMADVAAKRIAALLKEVRDGERTSS